jgi:S1-C subfamily serine protease
MKRFVSIILIGLVLMFGNMAKAQEIIIPIDEELNRIERIKESSVSIFAVGDNGFSRCSGVLIKEKYGLSHILTAKHCINIQEELYVENSEVEFIVVATNEDLAYLIVKKSIENKKPAELAKENAKIGEEVYHLGYPNWDDYTTSGPVLKNTKDWQLAKMQTKGGCSGGGIFNKDTELVGILWGGFLFESVSIFEPIEDINKFLRSIRLYTLWLSP